MNKVSVKANKELFDRWENVEEIGNIVDEIMTAVKEEIDGGEEVGG